MTWVWKVISDYKLPPKKVLDIEKMVTLVAAYHHIDTPNYPLGIRNKGPATTYLQNHNNVNLNEFIEFGRKNTIGYGNLYYSGPLATMYICSGGSGKYVFSNVGKQITEITENALKSVKALLLETTMTKDKLEELVPSCFCSEKISLEEKEIWRQVFFGFTKVSSGFNLDLDLDEFNRYNEGKMLITKIQPEAPPDLDTYLKFIGKSESIFTNSISNNSKFAEKSLQRRYVLLLIMKIIDASNPKVSITEINQAVRDCIYFNQYKSQGTIHTISFGKLEEFRETWEVYVHNLYYINFMEYMFNILLDETKLYPNGIRIDEIGSLFEIKEMLKIIPDIIGCTVSEEDSIQEIENKLRKKLAKKTSLNEFPNEKAIAFKIRSAISKEEKISNLLVLIILLKHRFDSFNEEQKSICYFHEKWWDSIHPKFIYQNLLTGSIRQFIEESLKIVKNRHKFISAKKFENNATKSWLLTEEDEKLYFYDRDYRRKFYRESKWTNIAQLLADLDLVKIQDKYSLTELGKSWLAKIA